jgi:CubicO group peptidase (beta-lactamase class C family)
MTPDIDTILAEAVRAAGLPGAVAIAANRSGIVHQSAIGERAPGVAMTLDSVARIASMTKAITSIAALRLVERGLLELDDPICDVLPELTEPMVFERFGVDSRPILHPATTPITLRHLLTHTAGYGYDTWNQPLGHIQTSLGLPRIPTTSDELSRVPLLFEPGTHWNYGINTDIVGRAVEVASGKRLDEALRDEVLAPLGMHDTMFLTGPDQEARRILMHRRQDDGTVIEAPMLPPETLPFMAGGGGLHSTALDYIKLLQAILAGGTSLVGPAMFEVMTTPQTGDVTVVPMVSAVPAMSNDVGLAAELELKWTGAFMINTQADADGHSAGRLSWAGLCNTYYWIDPARSTCGVFIAQLLPFADPATLAAFHAYEMAINQAFG